MRRAVRMLVLLAACGGEPIEVDDVVDATGPSPDAALTCGTTWQLRDAPATDLFLLDPVPATDGRTVRLGVTVELQGCDEPAMMTAGFTLEGSGVSINVRVWHPVGPDCPAESRTVIRPMTLELYPATWQIYAAGPTNPALTLTVAAAGATCDPSRATCQLDCDCDEGAGERCLGYSGLAGPATQCAVPCEADQDCRGHGCDAEVDDGLSYACNSGPECGPGDACRPGWTCEAGACTPDFALDNATRRECTCDADCDPGLRCAISYDPTAPRRCEALCDTAGNWCEGAHVCGWVGLDASGLAGVDSVCVWLGE